MPQYQIPDKAILAHSRNFLDQELSIQWMRFFDIAHSMKGTLNDQDAGAFAGGSSLIDQCKTG